VLAVKFGLDLLPCDPSARFGEGGPSCLEIDVVFQRFEQPQVYDGHQRRDITTVATQHDPLAAMADSIDGL
jgi:hypothetical protein